MGSVLAQDSAEETISFFDNTWPESFRFPFGEWLKELVFWAVNNPITSTIGDIIEWPFSTFFDLIMSDQVGRDSITTVPWVWLVVAVFVVASFTRNTRIGLACAAMLAVCGFLGAEYWTETAKTIGMILVSVTLCAIVGIPLGILSGRFDAVWSVVRPTLDAMQVVHSFVFMLPFIFFFGLGNVSATMVTMVFALPPLVRLTNLGIRQVPEDVVEASRAYGATELRVLTDVQLPLARPAIMTGLNQTLLLAISMLGIAALMGAGGLGRLLFRAINNLNLGLAASAGLAFFLVAVILDRISQTEAQDGVSMVTKIRQAFAYRADPQGLLDAQAEQAAPVEEEVTERFAPVSGPERLGLLVTVAGLGVALVSLLLPWAENAGKVAAWGRFADETDLVGMSFNGLEASGGTFFGIFLGVCAVLGLLAAVRPMLSFSPSIGRLMLKGQGVLLAAIAAIIVVVWLMNIFDVSTGPLSTIGLTLFAICIAMVVIETFAGGTPRLGADGALIASIGVLGAALGYLLLNPSAYVDASYSNGTGAILAVIAGLVAVGGSVFALLNAPYGPRRPLPIDISWGRVIASGFALLLIVGSALGVGNTEPNAAGAPTNGGWGWYFDERVEAIQRESADVPADIAAEIERLREEAGDDINLQIANAQAIQNLMNSVQSGDKIIHSGVTSDGPGLGWISMALAALAVVASIPASGLLGGGEQMRWKASSLMAGTGLAIMIIPMAFILGIVRVGIGSTTLGGIGAFMTFLAGFIVFSSGRSVVNEFRRKKIYSDVAHIEAALLVGDDDLIDVAEPVLEGASGAVGADS